MIRLRSKAFIIIFCLIIQFVGGSIAFSQTKDGILKYKGKMEVVFKGKKKPDIDNIVHYLKKTANADYELYIKGFKVGKMPGKMSFILGDLSMGTAFDLFKKELIKFEFPILPDKKYDAIVKGIINEDKIEYDMKTEDASYLGFSVDVDIHFVGYRFD